MYSRTNSVTMTLKRESFALSRTATRSTEPEVFTFERITPQAIAVPSYVPIRPKKRCTRVMYPAKVRMHLPPPEKNQAKRWLIILCLVVLWQIWTEEPCADMPLSSTDSSVSDYQTFPDLSVGSELLAAPHSSCQDESPLSSTCSQPVDEPETGLTYEQSAGKSYVMALLVYLRMGSDN